MAVDTVVVSNVLCYLVNKIGRTAVRSLQSMVLDFYDVEELYKAKCQLIKDIAGIKLDDYNVPYVPERRDGNNKAMRIVDDIFTLLTFLDEKLKLTLLPRYVADNPDLMPSARLYEGDLSVLMKIIERLEKEVKDLNIAMADMAKELQRSKHSASPQSVPGPFTSNVNNSRTCSQALVSQPNSVVPTSLATASRGSVVQPGISAAHPDINISSNRATGYQVAGDWAAAAAAVTSSPTVYGSRFSVLAVPSTDEEQDGEAYTEYHSRRSNKRMRQSSQLQDQQQLQRQRQQQQQPTDRQQGTTRDRRRGRQIMKGSSSSCAYGLSAAVNVIDKAVFCVDNLNSSVNEQKLRDFVQKELGVKVLSCFETKPRRWRSEASQNVNRVAFRLCIDSADCDRLLTSNKWPNSVTISEWYFIKPFRENRRQQTDWQQEREQVGLITGELLLTDTRPKNTTPAAIEAAGSSTELTDTVADADTDIAETDMEEMETTIVYNDGSTTTTAGV